MSVIKLIYAKSLNNVIGNNGQLPWRLYKDLEIFKDKTLGQTVVMGRKTYESLPPQFRPLPGRKNIVVTRNEFYDPGHPDVEVITNPNDFLMKHFISCFDKHGTADLEGLDSIWIIGGEELYNLSWKLAFEIHVTEVQKTVEGNVYAPEIDFSQFVLSKSSEMYTDMGSKLDFFITVFKRKLYFYSRN